MARLASHKNIMSPWRGYRDKDGLYRLLERKNNWIPASLRLCRACFRYRPKSTVWWEKEMQTPEFDDVKLSWYDILAWFQVKPIQACCPWCTVLGYKSYFREALYNHDREYPPPDDNGKSQKMCPELNRRIDRP